MTLPQSIRLVGLDLDGTTLNSKKQITPRTRAAIAGAIQKGITVLPATGRQLIGLPPAFMEIPGVRYALTSNGAKVYDVAENKVLHSDCLDVATAEAIMVQCRRYPCLVSVFIEGESYTDQGSFELAREFVPANLVAYFRTTRETVPDLAKTIRTLGKPVEKFSLNFKDEQARSEAWAFFGARVDLAVTSSIPGNIELNTRTAHKGAALLALGRLLGVPTGGVMAIGDSSNDLEMLKAAGFAVAMGNGTPDVKAVADLVAPGCDEDGVAQVLEALANNT